MRWLVFPLACLFCFDAHAGVLIPEDPGERSPRFPFLEKGQSGTRVEQDGEKFLRIDWDASKMNHCEFQFGQTVRLPEFRSARIDVTVWIPEGGFADSLNLRLWDKDGETFQFRSKIPAGVSGRQVISYEISEQTASGSWGGSKKNGIPDRPLRLSGFSIDFRKKTGQGHLLIGAVKLELSDSPVRLSLETGNPVYVVCPGEEEKLGLRITNPNSSAFTGQLEYRIRDIGLRELKRERRTVEVPPRESLFVPLPKPECYGVYFLTSDFTGDNAEAEAEMRYCYMPPAGPGEGKAEGFLFGICSHLERHPVEIQEKEVFAATLCGAKVMRALLDWKRLQPAPDRWRFGPIDKILDLLEKNNLELQGIYLGMPDWARAPEWKSLRPEYRTTRGRSGEARPDYKAWAEYIRTTAAHTRGKVRYVEVWNEPDLLSFADFSVEEYIEMLKIAYRETKSVAPETTVITGGFTNLRVPAARSSDPDHFRKTLVGARGFYDIVAFHAHGPFSYYRPQVDGLVKMLKELHVTVPWYANETAVSAIGVGEKEQAYTLFRKLLYSWANGAVGYNWYCLRNKGKNPGDNEHNFGLLTEDFYPKAAYPVYNMLANHYRGATFVKAYDFGRSAYGLLFRTADGDFLLGCWSDRLPQPVLASGLFGSVTRIDAWGNEVAVTPEEGRLLLAVTDVPQSFRFSGQGGEPLLHTDFLRTGDSDFLLPPGKSGTFRLLFHNPTDRVLDFPLEIVPSAGLEAGEFRTVLPLGAGESQTLELPLTASPNFRSHYGLLRGLQFTIGSTELFFPVHSMIEVAGMNFSRDPDFRLGDASQLTGFAENEPQTAHLFWSGKADLSADIHVGEDGENLILKIDVTDDRHHQPYRQADAWKGDGVQFALNLPEQGTFWEIGLSRLNSGAGEAWVWRAPAAFQAATVAAAIRVETSRDEAAKKTGYLAYIPFAAIGLTPELRREGIRFNLLVNDNDGEMRESFLAIAPGLGTEKRVSLFPYLSIPGSAAK